MDKVYWVTDVTQNSFEIPCCWFCFRIVTALATKRRWEHIENLFAKQIKNDVCALRAAFDNLVCNNEIKDKIILFDFVCQRRQRIVRAIVCSTRLTCCDHHLRRLELRHLSIRPFYIFIFFFFTIRETITSSAFYLFLRMSHTRSFYAITHSMRIANYCSSCRIL